MKTSNHISNKESEAPKSIYTARVVSYLSSHGVWKTKASEEDDPLFSFSWSPGLQFAGQEADDSCSSAHEVTRRFLGLRRRKETLEFFQEFGPLRLSPHPGSEQKCKADPVRLSSVIELGERFLSKLSDVNPPDPEGIQKAFFDWYRTQPLQAEFQWSSPLIATVNCRDVQECLRASFFLDSQHGLPWLRCARRGCTNAFRRDHKNGRLYCSDKCARHQAQLGYLNSPKGKKKSAERAGNARHKRDAEQRENGGHE
jgi:hypothetical protein